MLSFKHRLVLLFGLVVCLVSLSFTFGGSKSGYSINQTLNTELFYEHSGMFRAFTLPECYDKLCISTL